eukprot:TRINITY_DN2094_c0_g3_i1.p1 TRINITY_DN2094_c0_g3~~TRINITY_DN2094_c0_g3_i1.p1  ORF type:complete len:288 (-),score=23.92 TRINITY_DN2094_c0_g3_i1:146-1009(-)
MAEIDNVIINGQCISSLGRDMMLAKYSFDGLILGYVNQHEEDTINDHQDGAQKVVRTNAIITGLISNSLSHVLVDGVGEVHDQILRDMQGQLQRQQIIGWFVCRQGKMEPSMREQAGCVYMIRCLQTMQMMQQRMVFAIMQKNTEENEATLSLQYRFFQVNPKPSSFPVTTPLLTPVNSQILSGVPDLPQPNTHNYFELSHGTYDALGMQLEGDCPSTSLTSTMQQFDQSYKQLSQMTELQTNLFESMYSKLQSQLRKELQGLKDETEQWNKTKEQVEAARKEMQYD